MTKPSSAAIDETEEPAEALGWQADRIRRDATDCGACGSCPFGCVAGSKQSGIRVHLREAAAAGARIVDRVRVTKLLLDGGGRLAGVEGHLLATDPSTGMAILRAGDSTAAEVRPLVARARQVVPTVSDDDLWCALAAVHRLSDDVLGGRYALAEGAEEQLLGIALTVCREAQRRWA